MRTQLTLISLITLICGCTAHHTEMYKDSNTATCDQVAGHLNRHPAQSLNPASVPITATHRAHLLKKYNYHGCNANSDNRYVYPDQSLEINTLINNSPAPLYKSK